MFTMAPMIEERLIEDIVRVVEHNRRGSVTSLTVMENLDSSSFAGSTEEFTNLNDTARVRSDSVENNTTISSNSSNGNSNNKSDANDADETHETATEDPNASSEDPNHDNSSEDLLVQTTKSLQSLDLTSCKDDTHKDEAIRTCKSLPIPESHQDSTQKLSDDSYTAASAAAVDSSSQEKPPATRRGSRRRRRSLKDSLQALFSVTNSNSSNHSKRSSEARQRSSSPRSIHSGSSSSRGFTLSSLVQKTKRRSLQRKKNRRSRHHGGRRRSSFASLDLSLDLDLERDGGRSGPLRQSSSTAVTMRQSTSTAFTLAAREASEAFRLDEVMSDIEDDSCEALTPTSFQLDQTAATIH